MMFDPHRLVAHLGSFLAVTLLAVPLPSPVSAGEAGMQIFPRWGHPEPTRYPRNLVRAVQQGLVDRDFDPGPVDGLEGPKTRSALFAYQELSGLKTDGKIGPLSGDLSSKFVQVDLAIEDDEFDSTRDSHSTIALYALGMDTLARCGPRHEAARFFHLAYERLPEVVASIREAQALKEAIDAAFVRVREGCPESSP
jgi:peptidoglycan hydrolase-like protein with peptidoglycan-binding domain